MARKKEPIILDSIFFNYVGTDEQFNVFLKNVIKDYISEDKLLPNDENIDDKIRNWIISVNNEFVVDSDIKNYYTFLNK